MPQQGIRPGLGTKRWSEEQWRALVSRLVADDMVFWKDIAALVLGHLNPLQVGTSLASNKAMQARYGKGTTWQPVLRWLYEQRGRCSACGTRLELQVDHNVEKTTDLALMSLLCRRDNVIRRHRRGGVTDLTTESAVMWILLTLRPRTYADFVNLCRLEGLTVGPIRFQEAWAMAVWLAREGRYDIEDEMGSFVVARWPDNAVTRYRPNDSRPDGVEVIADRANSDDRLAFVIEDGDAYLYRAEPVSSLAFAVYDIAPRPAQEVSLIYQNELVLPRPPRHQPMLLAEVVPAGKRVALESATARGKVTSKDVTENKQKTFRTPNPSSIRIVAT